MSKPSACADEVTTMGSIRKEIVLPRAADEVWDAVRDYGAPHRRLAPRSGLPDLGMFDAQVGYSRLAAC
jgi:hypothetical protein